MTVSGHTGFLAKTKKPGSKLRIQKTWTFHYSKDPKGPGKFRNFWVFDRHQEAWESPGDLKTVPETQSPVHTMPLRFSISKTQQNGTSRPLYLNLWNCFIVQESRHHEGLFFLISKTQKHGQSRDFWQKSKTLGQVQVCPEKKRLNTMEVYYS